MNTRFTIGAVLNTISETAATVTSTMATINTTVSMANRFVTNAAEAQKERYAMDSKNVAHRIANEIAQDMISREDAVIAYCNGDQAKLDRHNSFVAELLEAAGHKVADPIAKP